MSKNLKLPKKLRIAGVDYDVIPYKSRYELQEHCDLPGAIGAINTADCEILISTDVHEQSIVDTVLHEVVHGVICHYRVPIPEDLNEIVTETLTAGLYQVFKDNPALLTLLKGGETNSKPNSVPKKVRPSKTNAARLPAEE